HVGVDVTPLVPPDGYRFGDHAFVLIGLVHGCLTHGDVDPGRNATIAPVSRSLAAPAASTKFGALHHRDYRRYFFFALIGQIAENVEHVISYWVIFQAFHSPTLAGFAVISHWVPYLLFSVYMGALADRYDCRKLIQISQGLFALASVAWGVLFLTATLRVWHAGVLLLIPGGARVIAGPGIH